MKNEFYILPDWDFVGGAQQSKTFILTNEQGEKQDIGGATVSFAAVDFVNPSSAPLLSSSVAIAADEDGAYCKAVIELDGADTADLWGKLLYQISIMDASGACSIPQQGVMHIYKNIDPAVKAQGG